MQLVAAPVFYYIEQLLSEGKLVNQVQSRLVIRNSSFSGSGWVLGSRTWDFGAS
jgi:hypothetical protein